MGVYDASDFEMYDGYLFLSEMEDMFFGLELQLHCDGSFFFDFSANVSGRNLLGAAQHLPCSLM